MFVLEDSSLLIIAGKFGSQMGEVSVNRNSSPASGGCPECLSIKQWTPDTIRAEIPLSGPYSAGDVVVWSKGRMSNARRLSEWRPTFKVEFVEGFGTHRWDGEIRLHFRADVSSFRQEAGKAPKYDTVPFQIARDSEGEFVASGEYMVPGGGKDKWIGTAHLTNRIANPFSPNQIESQGEIDTESPALRLFLLAIATDGMKIINNGTDTVPMPTVWGYADAFLSVLNPLPAVSIDMDSEFRILGDTRREVPGLPSPVLFWSDVAARFVPDPKLAR